MRFATICPILTVLTLAAIACIIRVSIAAEPLWLDEQHTAWALKDGLWHIGSRAALGNQTPLFFWLTWLPVHALGPSEYSVRLVSLLSGVTTLALAAAFVWRTTRSLAATMVTATLMALDWRFVFYATEARPYALLQCLGLIQAWLFGQLIGVWRHEKSESLVAGVQQHRAWLGWVIVSILLVWCHPTCVWLFAAEAIVWIVWLRAHGRGVSSTDNRTMLLSIAIVAVACLPLLPDFAMVGQRRANWSSVSSPLRLWRSVKEPLLQWVCLPTVVAFFLWLCGYASNHQPRERTRRCRAKPILLLFVALWAVVPIAGAVIADWWRVAPLALFRYTTIGTPVLAIGSGIAVGLVRWPWAASMSGNTCRLSETGSLGEAANPGLTSGATGCRASGTGATNPPSPPRAGEPVRVSTWGRGDGGEGATDIVPDPGVCHQSPQPPQPQPFSPERMGEKGALLWSEDIGTRLCRSLVAAIVLGIFLTNNDNARQLMLHRTVPHLRSENWTGPIGRIQNQRNKKHQPVFVFGNVLEDSAAFTDDNPAFQEYLLFPVSGFDTLDFDSRPTVQACPTSSRPHFLAEHFDQIANANGGWIIARAKNETVREILSELETGLKIKLVDKNVDKAIVVESEVDPSNDVQLFSIDLR